MRRIGCSPLPMTMLRHCLAPGSQVEQVQACLQQVRQTWDAIQGTTSCGRIAFAKARDPGITAFHEGIGQLTEIYSTRMVYEKALEQLNDEAHQLLTLAHDDATALSSNRVRDIDERRKFVQDYIRALDNRLVPTQGVSGKRAYVPLKMPRDLVDGLRGQELHISMDSHMESNRHKYYVVSHYVNRVGGDVDPVSFGVALMSLTVMSLSLSASGKGMQRRVACSG